MEKTQAIIEKINHELTELVKDSMRFGASEAAALDDLFIMTSVDLQDTTYAISLKIDMFN